MIKPAGSLTAVSKMISKTGEDSRGLEGTPGESNRCANSKVFTQSKPKSFAIIGLVFAGNKGSIPAASAISCFVTTRQGIADFRRLQKLGFLPRVTDIKTMGWFLLPSPRSLASSRGSNLSSLFPISNGCNPTVQLSDNDELAGHHLSCDSQAREVEARRNTGTPLVAAIPLE